MAAVVLQVEMHCRKCVSKIRKFLRNMHGVDRAWVYPQTGTVVVIGAADVSAIRRRILRAVGREAHVVSDGTWRYPPHYEGITHLAAPPPQYYPYGAGAGSGNHHYYSGWTPPPPYAYQYGTPTCFHYYPDETSACSIM